MDICVDMQCCGLVTMGSYTFQQELITPPPYVCVCYIFVYLFVCLCVDARGDIGCLPQLFSTLFVETGPSMNLDFTNVVRSTGYQAPGISSVLDSTGITDIFHYT